MRILALAILTIAAGSATSARAQTYNPKYPICLRIVQNFGGERYECAYTSLAQCAETASGLPAQCLINPFYAGETASPEGRERRYRRAY
jgi:DNA-binding transcriptional regulator LsrR (DeoR family)